MNLEHFMIYLCYIFLLAIILVPPLLNIYKSSKCFVCKESNHLYKKTIMTMSGIDTGSYTIGYHPECVEKVLSNSNKYQNSIIEDAQTIAYKNRRGKEYRERLIKNHN